MHTHIHAVDIYSPRTIKVTKVVELPIELVALQRYCPESSYSANESSSAPVAESKENLSLGAL